MCWVQADSGGARVAVSPCRGVSDPVPHRVCYPPALLLQPYRWQSMGSFVPAQLSHHGGFHYKEKKVSFTLIQRTV